MFNVYCRAITAPTGEGTKAGKLHQKCASGFKMEGIKSLVDGDHTNVVDSLAFDHHKTLFLLNCMFSFAPLLAGLLAWLVFWPG